MDVGYCCVSRDSSCSAYNIDILYVDLLCIMDSLSCNICVLSVYCMSVIQIRTKGQGG